MKATNEFPMYLHDESAEGREHPFFEDMESHHQRILKDAAQRKHFESGELIFSEGEPAEGLYLIQKGTVRLIGFIPGKGLVPIQTLRAGDVMGWSWMFPPYFWRFGARAVEETDALFLRGEPLRTECEADHEFGHALMKKLARIILDRLHATRMQRLENQESKLPDDGTRQSCPGLTKRM